MDSSLKLAYKYSRAQTKYYSKSFFLSSTLLPKDKRWDTFALYNFCRYVDNLVDKPRDRVLSALQVSGVLRPFDPLRTHGEGVRESRAAI